MKILSEKILEIKKLSQKWKIFANFNFIKKIKNNTDYYRLTFMIIEKYAS